MTDWMTKDIPDQTDCIAVITGATSGIGYETAKALAGAGARVIIASRNVEKGKQTLADIRAAHAGAEVSFEPLDLASLTSVANCATRLSASLPRIDLLINNAGVSGRRRRIRAVPTWTFPAFSRRSTPMCSVRCA